MNTILRNTAFALIAIFALSGCEQSANNNDNQEKDIIIVNADNTRLINYNTTDNPPTSRSASTSSINVATEVPSDASDMTSGYQNWKVKKNDIYVVPAGKTLSTDIKFDKDVEYYVQGNLTVPNAWGNNATIYVMEGGTLNYNLPNLQNNNTIINDGTLNLSSTFSIGTNGEIATTKPITVTDELAFDGGKLIADAQVTAGRLQFNQRNTNNTIFNDCVYADHVEFSNGTATINSCLIVNGDISFINGVATLGNDVLIQCEELFVEKTSFELEGQDNNYSVIDADKITLRQHNHMNTFQGCLDIHGEINNESGKTPKWQSGVIFNGSTYIEGDGCKPTFGEAPVEETVYTLKHISQLIPAEQDLSATSVCFDNDDSYVSWHKAGKKYKGWIDVINTVSTDAGQELQIESSLDAPNTDFNHINAEGSEITIAGGNAKGALVGIVNYNSSASEISLNTIQIEGTSGNSLLKINDDYIAVSGGSTGAMTTIEGDSKEVTDYRALPYSKYVFESLGETNILYNISGDISKVINISDEAKSFDVGTISTKNGKNACTADTDGKIYVSMGAEGLKIFENGVEVGNFLEKSKENGDAVNCVAVDDNYIYVAYGTLGLYVLNKDDQSIVSNYKYSDASANFVKKRDDGLIYIAYGTDGVHVLKLEVVE